MLDAPQCATARNLLKWSKERLALEAETAPKTIAKFEAGKIIPKSATLMRIAQALELAGVEFTAENGGAVLRLRK
jgi:transcriptional regulator with XRE-family HTH domain